MSLKHKGPIKDFEKIIMTMIFFFFVFSMASTQLFALESNESLAARLQSYAGSTDPRFATYVKTIFGSNHVKMGYNVSSDPISILDVLTPRAYSDAQIAAANPLLRASMLATPSAPSIRLVHGANTNAPSFAHYGVSGHWIIQSSSQTSGIVFLQARGGAVQIGSPDVGTSAEYTKKIANDSVTSLNVYAETSHFYKNVIIHNPSAPQTTLNLFDTLSRVQQGSSMTATEFIDSDNPIYTLNPSGNSVLGTITLKSISDSQRGPAPGNLVYTLDLDKRTILNDLDVQGSLGIKGGRLSFPSGSYNFTLGVDVGTFVLDSTDIAAGLSRIQVNRILVANSADPKKINIQNIAGNTQIDGIYFLGKPALTANESSYGTLYINSRNQFGMVSIGDPARITNNVTVYGSMTVKGSLTVDSTSSPQGQFIGYGTIPIGGIIMWSGTTIPDGWALCDGRTVNRRRGNTNLYEQVTLPNLANKFIIGAIKKTATPNDYYDLTAKNNASSLYKVVNGANNGASSWTYYVGEQGGSDEIVLTEAQLAKHYHRWVSYRSGGDDWGGTTDHDWLDGGHKSGEVPHHDWGEGASAYILNTSRAGGDAAHENRPRFYALAFIMRIK